MIDQILAWANMEMAWEEVRANRGAPGIDGVTLARWERNRAANIERLCVQVRTNTYHPNRPKRFTVMKKGGGTRELARLTVTDKVLQRAVLNVAGPAFEARFLPCSHGFRQNRSVATAVQQVLNYRDHGLRWVLDADIAACFDHLDHELLLGLARRVVDDWHILNLLALWLKAGSVKQIPNLKSQIPNQKTVGVPMGAVISPLLCNVLLHQLDARLTTAGWRLVRYADDFVILTESEEAAMRALKATETTLNALRLQLSARKTRVVSFDEGFTFLGVTFYRDRYTYEWQQKRIEIEGRNVRWLYRHAPAFY